MMRQTRVIRVTEPQHKCHIRTGIEVKSVTYPIETIAACLMERDRCALPA